MEIEDLAERQVRPWKRFIELQRLTRGRLRLGDRFTRREGTAEQELHLYQRQLGVCLTKVRLDRNRLLEIRNGPAE